MIKYYCLYIASGGNLQIHYLGDKWHSVHFALTEAQDFVKKNKHVSLVQILTHETLVALKESIQSHLPVDNDKAIEDAFESGYEACLKNNNYD